MHAHQPLQPRHNFSPATPTTQRPRPLTPPYTQAAAAVREGPGDAGGVAGAVVEEEEEEVCDAAAATAAAARLLAIARASRELGARSNAAEMNSPASSSLSRSTPARHQG